MHPDEYVMQNSHSATSKSAVRHSSFHWSNLPTQLSWKVHTKRLFDFLGAILLLKGLNERNISLPTIKISFEALKRHHLLLKATSKSDPGKMFCIWGWFWLEFIWFVQFRPRVRVSTTGVVELGWICANWFRFIAIRYGRCWFKPENYWREQRFGVFRVRSCQGFEDGWAVIARVIKFGPPSYEGWVKGRLKRGLTVDSM